MSANIYDAENKILIPFAGNSEASAASLDGLSDVNISSPTDGQTLTYDAENEVWVNGAGATVIESLGDIADVDLTNLQDGQTIVWDDTEQKWIPGTSGQDYTAGFGININDDEISTTDFVGTQAEWNALTAEEKAEFDIVNLTDDVANGGAVVVDTVAEGNMNAVSSNAVAGAILLDAIVPKNAGARNSIYRGKSLGSSVTTEQYATIAAGTFDDLFIGDYWTIGGVNYRIAAFDYWLNAGDTNCTTHHVIVVPDTILYIAKMNNTNITTGGYTSSLMCTTNLENAKTTINSAFGSSHILNHRELFTISVDTNGKANNWAWKDSTVDLMNEYMVYGHNAWGGYPGYETGIDKSQLPLFALSPDRITNRADWWLRDVFSASHFAIVGYNGNAYIGGAMYALGVRPAFGIIG